MRRHGLLIQYEYCIGCQACEAACKQEHNFPPDKWGIIVNEIFTRGDEKPRIDYIPFPTEYCDLCSARTARGELPVCMTHCQARCIAYGNLAELANQAQEKPRSVIFAPRASFDLPIII